MDDVGRLPDCSRISVDTVERDKCPRAGFGKQGKMRGGGLLEPSCQSCGTCKEAGREERQGLCMVEMEESAQPMKRML